MRNGDGVTGVGWMRESRALGRREFTRRWEREMEGEPVM